MKKSSLAFMALILMSLTGCPNGNDPYAPSPYDRGYGYEYDGHRDDYYRRRDYERKRDLERERDRLEDERERLERTRRENREQHRESYRPAPEHCPSGFSPSERKCSSDERRRGCRDMRLPGGLGCVSR